MKKLLFFLFLWIFHSGFPQNDSLLTEELSKVKYLYKRKLGSYLSREWELDGYTKRGTFRLVTYHPNYVMPFRWTDRFNREPYTDNPNRPKAEFRDYQNVETRFQISVKTKIIQDAFWGKGDFWVGYTQVAYWQVYNGNLSRPFREMNYEPELMFVMPLNFSIGNFKWRIAQISVNHQSNGKEHTLSRSWNRIIFSTFYEWGNFIFQTRTMWRFKEKNEQDDNPNIQDYVGRWQFVLGYNAGGGHTFVASTRNNMIFKHNRNYAQFVYQFPLSGHLKGVFEVSHGYGDSLIEYNHKQTSIGIGVVLMEM